MGYSESHLDKGAVYDDHLAAEAISAYMNNWESRILARVITALPGGPVGRYLDFACGTGRITQIVAPYAQKSYGIDVSESMVSEARSKCPETEFILADLTATQIDLAPVDVVTSFRFFGNAEQSLRHKVLCALNGRLAMGGHLVINSHRNPWTVPALLHRAMGRRSELDLSYPKLRRLLKDTGFRVRHVHAMGAWMIREKFYGARYLESPAARVLELFSRIPGAHYISPNALIVAEKVAVAGN